MNTVNRSMEPNRLTLIDAERHAHRRANAEGRPCCVWIDTYGKVYVRPQGEEPPDGTVCHAVIDPTPTVSQRMKRYEKHVGPWTSDDSPDDVYQDIRAFDSSPNVTRVDVYAEWDRRGWREIDG